MKKLHGITQRLTVALFVLGAPTLLLNHAASAQSSTQPDDSAQNKGAGQTADNQPNSKNDLQTTADVRKAIIADKGPCGTIWDLCCPGFVLPGICAARTVSMLRSR
jgi:hypothetical protein